MNSLTAKRKYLRQPVKRSAAPELFAAANFALDWLDSFNIPPQTTPNERDEVRAILRAAIDAATKKAKVTS